MARSIIEAPSQRDIVRFSPDFGQRVLLTVDTEEEFDWDAPFSASGHSLDHIPRLAKFQQFCEGIGISPVYLIDWPVASSPLAKDILSGPLAEGKAEIGVQLHPWVNPPHDEEVNHHNSFAGNLPHKLENAKFRKLLDKIRSNFGVEPMIYRAGRYGAGNETAAMLKSAGLAIDSSVRSNFDYRAAGGPDYSGHPLQPYWIEEDGTKLLELPLTTVFWGMLRKQGRFLYPKLQDWPAARSLLAKTGLLERIPLTPEGVSADEALRGIDIAIDDGLPVLVLSFHSPSLIPGSTPYVRSEDDLDRMYDWWRRIFTYLDMRGIRPTTVEQIVKSAQA